MYIPLMLPFLIPCIFFSPNLLASKFWNYQESSPVYVLPLMPKQTETVRLILANSLHVFYHCQINRALLKSVQLATPLKGIELKTLPNKSNEFTIAVQDVDVSKLAIEQVLIIISNIQDNAVNVSIKCIKSSTSPWPNTPEKAYEYRVISDETDVSKPFFQNNEIKNCKCCIIL